jgi:hypothetical protein
MIRMLGAMADASEGPVSSSARQLARGAVSRSPNPGTALVATAEGVLQGMGRSADTWVGWVSELVEIAGGIFADRAACALAKDRIVTPEEVVACKPRSDHWLVVREEDSA